MKFKSRKELEIRKEMFVRPTIAYNFGLEVAFKSFVERIRFYEKYKDDKEGLMEKEPRIFLIFVHQHKEGEYKTQEDLDNGFRNWFFSYCFGDVI